MTEMLKFDIDDRHVTTITLNRPDVHNAFNAALIAQLDEAFDQVGEAGPRVLVLTGAGDSFSAGADLNWMRSMVDASEADNRADARRLASMLRKLDRLPCPTIARVNGSAFGGGVGLIACCDLAVTSDAARFGLTEVRLGLAPATIAPFVIDRIGVQHARRYMLTGERMDAPTACRIGLVTEVVAPEQLDDRIEGFVDGLLSGGPRAQAHIKELIRTVTDHSGDREALDRLTSELIAALRVSREGQEGLAAFFDRRRPDWGY
jgi:methylglutaconyl-CoA hydratase